MSEERRQRIKRGLQLLWTSLMALVSLTATGVSMPGDFWFGLVAAFAITGLVGVLTALPSEK